MRNSEEVERVVNETIEVIKERDVPLQSLTLAALLASLQQLGILTQGTVATLAKYFSLRIIAYMIYHKIVDMNKSVEENLMSAFKQYGFKDSEISINSKNGEVEIDIVTAKCKLCPKGVGGAELEGNACPVPYLVSYALTAMEGKTWKPELIKNGSSAKLTVVSKTGGICRMKIKRTE
ncbi:hypothetical protein EYM_01570 [Ignicoccus islandicus DSM 13165]|uniref:4-vinyl reductase 4VR domain-containing protein n=1 Tax=Ignicoccus islandicus DSM 13165 TaxID=940295 RepID=A0A0U3EAN3_9CREN|nr:hypothetical protein [Ignicoccus islandicus]ALU11491.1 hypothetical protein EYM_01570 [Ignicoccus islandicus DSM 13165]